MTEEIVSPNTEAVNTESAPVEETEVTTDAVNEEESATSTEGSTEVEGSEPKQSKAVKELISVRKRAQQAESEAAYYKALAQAGSGQGLPPQAPQPAYNPQKPAEFADVVAPKQEDFDTWEAYEAKKEEYLIAKAGKQFMEQFNKNISMYNQSQAERTFETRIEAAAKENPAIRAILADNTLPINNNMAEVVKASELAPQLLTYLNENRAEAARIYGLSPMMAAKELGRVEALIQNTPKAAPPKRVSQAPEPIKTVNGVGSPVTDESKLSMDEWVERRNMAQYKKK